MKNCLICNRTFETKKGGEGRVYCFDCSPSYIKGNNQSRGEAITSIRRAIKRELVYYKGGQCVICGYNKCFANLEFHHIDPQGKDFSISEYKKIDMDHFKKEVDKCQLVCNRCHGEIHYLAE